MAFSHQSGLPSVLSGWKAQALRIVESLFPTLETAAWDDLMELWQALRSGQDEAEVLRHFYHNRQKYEAQQYVPFYRLRKTLEHHLRLETRDEQGQCAEIPFELWAHEGLSELRAYAQAEHFSQHQVPVAANACPRVSVRVIEAV
jgi:hypothetical protein